MIQKYYTLSSSTVYQIKVEAKPTIEDFTFFYKRLSNIAMKQNLQQERTYQYSQTPQALSLANSLTDSAPLGWGSSQKIVHILSEAASFSQQY